MKRSCDACGQEFTAKTRRKRYCDRPDCKRRRERGRKNGRSANVIAFSSAPKAPPESESIVDTVEAATRAELKLAGKLDTSLGRTALALARRLDGAADDTGSSVAALAKQHVALMTEALKGVQTEDSPLDELRAQREKRLRGA